MQPADTVRPYRAYSHFQTAHHPPQALTRMYNQPTKVVDGRHVGLLYKNPIDCLWKTLKTEGPFGWYKGTYSRFTPTIFSS